ncbi:MAG: phosphotransacetylase [Balneolaceae bacterium]
MSHIEEIRNRAAVLQKKVLLPEAGQDIRVLKAAEILDREKLAFPVLLGDRNTITEQFKENMLHLSTGIEIRPVDDPANRDEIYLFFKEKLSHKNLSEEEVRSLCLNPLFCAGWMLTNNLGDTAVGGSVASTSDVIRAALRTVGVSKESSLVSSTFLMEMKNGQVFSYADCAVVPYPDAGQLASIAIDTGHTHKKLTGKDPVIAFLSFSTHGSARHERVDLVKEAFEIARKKQTDWVMDGELQFDTAYLPEVAQRKAPGSTAAGKADVYIFPNLDAGNIAYKITERMGGATATGPVLQGLSKPFMDLSRGCSVDDIVNAACVGVLLGS